MLDRLILADWSIPEHLSLPGVRTGYVQAELGRAEQERSIQESLDVERREQGDGAGVFLSHQRFRRNPHIGEIDLEASDRVLVAGGNRRVGNTWG